MRRLDIECAILAGAMGAAGAPAQTVAFTDRSVPSGLNVVQTMLPTSDTAMMTGGIAVGDFDRDGWQDVFVLGGPSSPDRLLMNSHDGTFTDRAQAWGVDRLHWGFGIAVGDYNNDGWLDVFVTSGGADAAHGRHLLYRNSGNNTFAEVAAVAAVASTAPMGFDGFGAAWGDYDLDGRLDLAVAGWVYGSGGNRLFHNSGNGTFSDATPALNSNMTMVLGFSPRFADMNGDRYPELLWAGDFGTSRYFRNNGNATFTDVTLAAGIGLEANGMGSTVGDFNNDGLPDWYVTSIFTSQQVTPGVPGTGNMLYLNTGNHHFSEVGVSAGVRNTGWGWGTVAADLRNSGVLDIVATNGWQGTNFNGQFLADPTCVFLNTGSAVFSNVAPGCGVTHTGQGRGLLNFDYDNDGDQDLLIGVNGGPVTLYRNDVAGPAANALRVLLNTQASTGLAPDGYGAHVIATINGVQRHRWINGGSNYLSQSELSAHFGLGAATTVSMLRVEWPDGSVTQRANVAANQTITISSCPGDWNADGSLNVSDIFSFLQAWFAGAGDFDASGATTVQDIFGFLGSWFAACG